MINFSDPGKYRLEVEGGAISFEAWMLTYGQHYMSEIQLEEEDHFVVELELSDEVEFHEIENSLFSMVLTTVHIKKVDYNN